MTGVRRELPRSTVAGRPGERVPHRCCEGSPSGRDRPPPHARRRRWSGRPDRLVGGDRPDEPGELAGAGDDDLLVGLAAAGHPLPAAVQTLLAAPRAPPHGGGLVAGGGGGALNHPPGPAGGPRPPPPPPPRHRPTRPRG